MSYIVMAAYTNYRRDPRVKREAEALVGEGHKVLFLARRQPGEPLREVISGVEVRKLASIGKKPTSFAQYMVDYLLFFLMLFIHLTLHPRRYDLVHISNMPDFLAIAALVPRLMGRPVIHDVHDLMPEIYMEKFGTDERHWVIKALLIQEKWAGKFASAVLTVEERLKEILSNRGIGREKIHILMNLPDESIFQPRISPTKRPGAPFVMVYHGTLARRLGLDIAIQAVARVKDAIENLELRIIGDGEERENLVGLAQELGLDGTVTFSQGFVPVNQVPDLISDADLAVVPLRRCSGTEIMLPTKLLEYVSLGIPTITTKTRTIERYFDDTMVAFVEGEDIEALSQAILHLYQDPQKREQLSQNAAKKFLEKYSWQTHKKIYINLVTDLLTGKKSAN